MKISHSLLLSCFFIASCSNKKEGSQSYSFSTPAAARLSSTKLTLTSNPENFSLDASGPQKICQTGQTITCVAPTAFTGKYFGVGLLIQSEGKGMLAYLLSDEWSSIRGNSTTYDFDFKTPVTSSGSLKCCGGEGNLSAEGGGNSYISNAAFLFGYLDVTFKIPYNSTQLLQVSAEMAAAHTVRMIFADDIVATAKRGDLLYKDNDNTFKWIDSNSGALTATRPTSPVTMDTKVVNYEQPFEGSTSPIPILYTEIQDPPSGKHVVAESDLKAENKTYKFDYDPSYSLVIMLASTELTIIQSKKELLSRLHLQGLPHSKFTGFAASGVSTLTIE